MCCLTPMQANRVLLYLKEFLIFVTQNFIILLSSYYNATHHLFSIQVSLRVYSRLGLLQITNNHKSVEFIRLF